MTRPVLDVTAGTRAMWFDKTDQRSVFGDARTETITVTDRTRGRQDGTRTLSIAPDVQLDFRALPFASESFRLVVFDPPHLTRAGAKSWLAARYGVLGSDWRDDLKRGFSECFRVLMPGGVLIFKWSEVQVPLSEVLALTDARPLFGHASGRRSGTHWMTFLKDEAADDTAVHLAHRRQRREELDRQLAEEAAAAERLRSYFVRVVLRHKRMIREHVDAIVTHAGPVAPLVYGLNDGWKIAKFFGVEHRYRSADERRAGPTLAGVLTRCGR